MKTLRYCLLLFVSFIVEVNPSWTQELFSTRNNITYITMDNGLLHNYIDAFIAAIAIFHNFELYTLNVKDFIFIPGLKLYQPVF
ncbi:hypothetical protein FACS189437_07700 [Bacteroidia bacterium]|nr:hypothetical protein FACS189437_07700 [Bacteroidia bacterium]